MNMSNIDEIVCNSPLLRFVCGGSAHPMYGHCYPVVVLILAANELFHKLRQLYNTNSQEVGNENFLFSRVEIMSNLLVEL